MHHSREIVYDNSKKTNKSFPKPRGGEPDDKTGDISQMKSGQAVKTIKVKIADARNMNTILYFI